MFICMATIRFVKRIFDQRRMERKKAGHQPDLRSSETVVYLSDQNSSDPSVTRRPPMRTLIVDSMPVGMAP